MDCYSSHELLLPVAIIKQCLTSRLTWVSPSIALLVLKPDVNEYKAAARK